MVKFKHSIIKNKLSWENKNSVYICDHKNCSEIGKFKAPKSRLKLNEYYFFCLKHIKSYNKSWDFYKGLTVDQIELSLRKDTLSIQVVINIPPGTTNDETFSNCSSIFSFDAFACLSPKIMFSLTFIDG